VNVPVFLAALYFITSFSDEWEGEIARGLQLAGLGLILQILLWIPHILWHTVAMPQNFAPSMLGITASWWLAFFHFSTVASMVLVVHGFRILHSEFA
ncbi:MAG: hypothetical protein SVU32_00065, partial [Candidatus Nanohaloarchaea archaeon]|nr:hypothetical protein [Candidatus Nanohaloarchaea archaeon]